MSTKSLSLESVVEKYFFGEKFIPKSIVEEVLKREISVLNENIFYNNIILGGYGFVSSLLFMNTPYFVEYFKNQDFGFFSFMSFFGLVYGLGAFFLKRQIKKVEREKERKELYEGFLLKQYFYNHPVFFYPFEKQVELNNIKRAYLV